MPDYSKDPKRDHDFDNHPYISSSDSRNKGSRWHLLGRAAFLSRCGCQHGLLAAGALHRCSCFYNLGGPFQGDFIEPLKRGLGLTDTRQV